MEEFIHQHCLNPVRITDVDGSLSYVPCGYCSACQAKKRSRWAHRLELHCKTFGLFPVFVTLTYDNNNLPLLYYDEDNNISHLTITATRKLPSNVKRLLPSDTYDPITKSYYRSTRRCIKPDYINDLSLSDNFKPHYVINRHGNNYTYNEENCMAVCYLPDIQNFIKRLRFCLSQNPLLCGKDTSFDYFICSEYGPETYRPHYHGLLFFRSYEAAALSVEELIYKCWSKQNHLINAQSGSPIATHVAQGFAASAYVSKYVSCSSDLPFVLKLPPFAPFHTQSKSIPIGSISFDVSRIPEMLDKDDLLYCKSYIDPKTKETIDIKLPYPPQCWSRVFPKFLRSRLLDVCTTLQIFFRLHQIVTSGTPLPDLRPQLESLGLNSVVSLHTPYYIEKQKSSYTTHHPSDKYDLSALSSLPNHYALRNGDVIQVTPDAFVSRRLVNASNHTYKITPSLIIKDSQWIINHLDLYLFGFEQNRCACRKLMRSMSSIDWCKNPVFYASLYNRYYTKSFTLNLRSYYDRCLSSPEVTPFDLSNIYNSFFHSLPAHISDLTESQYLLLDNLTYMYNLDISDFYGSNDQKHPYHFLSSDVGLAFVKSLQNKYLKQKNTTLFKHHEYNDL